MSSKGSSRLSIDIKTRMVSFWSKLLSHEGNQVASSMYQIIYDMHKNNIIKSEYSNNILKTHLKDVRC